MHKKCRIKRVTYLFLSFFEMPMFSPPKKNKKNTPIEACFVTCSGQTRRKRSVAGVRMRGALVLPAVMTDFWVHGIPDELAI